MKALMYHHDINFDEPLHLIAGNYKWKTIESRLSKMIKSPHKIFTSPIELPNKRKKPNK
jgi:hypothetical protein